MEKTVPRLVVRETAQGHLLAAGSALAALAAGSCCVLPPLLAAAGVGGASVAVLATAAPYQPVFLLAAAGFLLAGFRLVYRRGAAACRRAERGTALSRRATEVALWSAAAILALSASAEWWLRLLPSAGGT